MCSFPFDDSKWNHESHHRTTRRLVPGAQLGGVAIQLLEPRARIGEAEVEPARRTRRSKARAVVADHYLQGISGARRPDVDDAKTRALPDAVADRVLHDGLQRHVRHG